MTMDSEATNKLGQDILSYSVEKVMVRNIPQVTPYWQMRHIKELMRVRRLDGVPVTDEEGHLLGIISISDLIICIENKDLEAPVSKYMTTPVKYLILNKTLIEALREMNRFKFGRLPVVDEEFRVIGVVYWWSLFAFLQEALDTEMVVKKTTPSEGVISYTYQILGKDFVHAGNASLQMRKSLQQLSIDPKDLRRIGIIAYEAEMNIIIHADRGSLQAKVNSEKVEVIAEDKGPGIPDVNLALQEGFTTAPDYIREMGFGAGMGLPNIKRNADFFQVDSRVGVGTKIYAVVNLNRR